MTKLSTSEAEGSAMLILCSGFPVVGGRIGVAFCPIVLWIQQVFKVIFSCDLVYPVSQDSHFVESILRVQRFVTSLELLL